MKSYYEEIFDTFNLDVLNRYELVFEDTLTKNINKDLVILHDVIAKSQKKVLLMYDNNPVWDFENYFLKLSNQIDDVYLSSSNLLNLWGEHPRIVYFPTFYFTQLGEQNYQTYNKNYRFSFLSNKPRFHRIFFYYNIKKYISDTDVVSVNNTAFKRDWWKDSYIRDMIQTIGHYDKSIEEDLPFITDNALLCNEELNSVGDNINDHSNKHIAYDSYFNVVGETDNSPNHVFVTEKTWKAVRSGTIPIFFESETTIDALTKLGFKFDNELNIKTNDFVSKVNRIAEYVKNMDIENIEKLYKKELPQIEKNINRFYDEDLLDIFISHITHRLSM